MAVRWTEEEFYAQLQPGVRLRFYHRGKPARLEHIRAIVDGNFVVARYYCGGHAHHWEYVMHHLLYLWYLYKNAPPLLRCAGKDKDPCRSN